MFLSQTSTNISLNYDSLKLGNNSLNYDSSKLGINAGGSLTVLGDPINYDSNQFNTTNNLLNIKSIATTHITGGTPTYTNGILTNAGNNNIYITYTNNGTITFPINTICEILVVGAGGKDTKAVAVLVRLFI